MDGRLSAGRRIRRREVAFFGCLPHEAQLHRQFALPRPQLGNEGKKGAGVSGREPRRLAQDGLRAAGAGA